MAKRILDSREKHKSKNHLTTEEFENIQEQAFIKYQALSEAESTAFKEEFKEDMKDSITGEYKFNQMTYHYKTILDILRIPSELHAHVNTKLGTYVDAVVNYNQCLDALEELFVQQKLIGQNLLGDDTGITIYEID